MPLAAIAIAAFAAEIPFFFFGTASGHDVEFHLYSWLEVLSQWRQGIFFPRWAALAHFGYGEPRFIFYPPASWTLGAILTAIFPWKVVPEIYIWLALVGAGIAMFLLAREFFSLRDATFAAVLYAVNPYHLVIIFWRSAFAELLASSLPPLLLLLVCRLEKEEWKKILPLAFLMTASWLINAPAAVMIHYSLALLVMVIAWQKRSLKIIYAGIAAIALGAMFSAFYLIPAVYEQRWVNIGEAVSGGSRPLDNFLFVHTDDADHDAFNRVMSTVAATLIALTLMAGCKYWRSRDSNRRILILLVAWAAACSLMMFPFSNALWKLLPKLQFMQFPWRWTLCLAVPFTLLVTLAIRRWPARAGIYSATLCILIFCWLHFQVPWWDTQADLRELQENVSSGIGFEGTDEYTPGGADASTTNRAAPLVIAADKSHIPIRLNKWAANEKDFVEEYPTKAVVILHLFNYPAWRVEVNGASAKPSANGASGEMIILLPPGQNHVRVTFIRTWDRTAGAWISLIALTLTIISMTYSSRLAGNPPERTFSS